MQAFSACFMKFCLALNSYHIKKVSPLLIALYNRSSGEALITAFCSFLYKNFSPHWKNKRRYAMIGR